MKKIPQFGKTVAILTLVWGAMANSALAIANSSAPKISESEPTPSQDWDNFQLSQDLTGQCRAAARSTFVYKDRSPAAPIRALETNEKVILAEGRGQNGWIAINSPLSGFVQTANLKFCPGTVSSAQPNLCRQVIFPGEGGIFIREQPNTDSTVLGTVYLGNKVILANPPQFRPDSQGRQWAKLAVPVVGWMSNGFPGQRTKNLGNCSQ